MQQVDVADALCKSYMNWFCKDVKAQTLNDIVPECASAAKAAPPLVPPPSTNAFTPVGKHLVMLKIDLNIPNVTWSKRFISDCIKACIIQQNIKPKTPASHCCSEARNGLVLDKKLGMHFFLWTKNDLKKTNPTGSQTYNYNDISRLIKLQPFEFNVYSCNSVSCWSQEDLSHIPIWFPSRVHSANEVCNSGCRAGKSVWAK